MKLQQLVLRKFYVYIVRQKPKFECIGFAFQKKKKKKNLNQKAFES